MKKKPERTRRKRTASTTACITDAETQNAIAPEALPFFIVGIGASAGGLEALEAFFSNVPQQSGLAFVVVQHLDPNHKGMMAELLQRSTAMPVQQIEDRLKVVPNHVYVIPPNKDLSILHGVLHLLAPVGSRGLRLPIDSFLRALADDQHSHGIGVILSGMGSDGALGLQAIKEKAGLVFVQDPASAGADSMPRSAIEAGLADVIARPEELPEKIIATLQHRPVLAEAPLLQKEKALSALEKIVILLRMHTGNDFSLYKNSTLYRRIERRMGLHQLTAIQHYVQFLRENKSEVELLFKELLIGVTSFFRDREAWQQLRDEALPELLKAYPRGGILRAWIPACSTGEEAYSLAISFCELVEDMKAAENYSLTVFATDLDREAIEKARQGMFPENIALDVSPERLQRFFVREKHGYRVGKQIREMVIFAPQNVTSDPPFTKLDFLSCRNLLIYLEPALQMKLLPLFHYSLKPGGILFLGRAEGIGNSIDLFETLPGKNRLFRTLKKEGRINLPDYPSAETSTMQHSQEKAPDIPLPVSDTTLHGLADKLLLQNHTPAAVLTTAQGDILYFSGRTGKYLDPAAGKANLNIFAMACEGLRYELGTAITQALGEEDTVIARGVRAGANGITVLVDITVEPLDKPSQLRGMLLIVFTDVPAPPLPEETALSGTNSGEPRVQKLEQALKEAHEKVQTLQQKLQSSLEEFRSAKEELQSTNEELQSTNEELTTSKEEMQSMNEELQTLNHEMQAKMHELSHANNDLMNLINSTEIAILFLDKKLHIRRFTPEMNRIIKLIPGDIGRPVTDLVTELDYPSFTQDMQDVLRTLVFRESTVATCDERWFKVRIMPYRTYDDRIDGLVITFSDITLTSKLEAKLQSISNERET